LRIGDWKELDQVSTKHLEETRGKSYKGFFYLGVSLYKTEQYEDAITVFQRAEELYPEDP
jgi:tetratricopeptide (TPR) repeat protein